MANIDHRGHIWPLAAGRPRKDGLLSPSISTCYVFHRNGHPSAGIFPEKGREAAMFRIDLMDTAILRMSGRMAEGCREEVESVLGERRELSHTIVDLSEVTYIDRTGEELLSWLDRCGARFLADSSYVSHICERLHLKMSRLPIASGHWGGLQGGARNGRHIA
jgi:hypothetical protein